MKKLLCNVLVSMAWPSAAFAADTTERGSLLIGLLVPLIAASAALLALLWWLKRGKTLGGSAGPLKLVQAVAVGARERVVVLDAQGRRLVIGVTANKIELLAELHGIDTSMPTS